MKRSRTFPPLLVAVAAAVAFGPGGGSALAATTVDLQPQPFGSRIAINGEADADVIAMSVSGTTITVTDTGPGGIAEIDPDCTLAMGTVSCLLDPTDPAPPALPTAPVDNSSVFLNAGTDSFTTDAPFSDDIFWSSGDKTLSTGPGADIISNGPGNDLLDAGEGNDSFRFSFSADGADVFNGGPGDSDRIDYDGQDPVSVSLDGQPNDGRAGEGDNVLAVEQIRGSGGDDTLMGDDGSNEISGSSGNDLILGLGGSDGLMGDDGDDTLVGGGGRDGLHCELGFDTAVVDPFDVVDGCERRGAVIAGETVRVGANHKGKARISCPLEEANPCVGALVLLSSGIVIGTGNFNLAAGQTKSVNVKLNKKGRGRLAAGDGVLVADAEVQTQEPAGLSVSDGEVILKRVGESKRRRR